MSHRDLFGLTFDQQLKATGGQIEDVDIAPNRRITGEVIFEPTGTGRTMVSARDSDHRMLWAYVGSEGTLRQSHCLVAVGTTLQEILAEELRKQTIITTATEDPIADAQRALDELENTLKWLRSGVEVQKASDATVERAQVIARAASDSDRQIRLVVGSLRGMRAKADEPEEPVDVNHRPDLR